MVKCRIDAARGGGAAGGYPWGHRCRTNWRAKCSRRRSCSSRPQRPRRARAEPTDARRSPLWKGLIDSATA